MKQLAAIIACVGLAACTTAAPVSRSETGTTIRYDPALYSAQDIQARADAICAAYDRNAVFSGSTNENQLGIGMEYASYDCVP